MNAFKGTRAVAIFTKTYGTITVRVRVLASVDAVNREWVIGGRPRQTGRTVHAFFQPDLSPLAKTAGTIVIPAAGKLAELVPHEVTHAVLNYSKRPSSRYHDEEYLATAVGQLTARIFRQLARRGIEVTP